VLETGRATGTDFASQTALGRPRWRGHNVANRGRWRRGSCATGYRLMSKSGRASSWTPFDADGQQPARRCQRLVRKPGPERGKFDIAQPIGACSGHAEPEDCSREARDLVFFNRAGSFS